MEEIPGTDDRQHESQSIHSRLWKHFHKPRALLGSKPGSDPKGGGKKAAPPGGGKISFKINRRQVLDRVFSSSQPNLCCSGSGSGSGPAPGSRGHREQPGGQQKRLSPLVTADHQREGRPSRPRGQAQVLSLRSSASHHKSSSLGTSELFHKILDPSGGDDRPGQALPRSIASGLSTSYLGLPLVAVGDSKIPSGEGPLGNNMLGSSNTNLTSTNTVIYQLNILLKSGHNLAVRDRGGTSDPYVKFKIAGKEVFRSKIIHKNLNPVWNEGTTFLIENTVEPLYVKVYDYDFGLQDDFMGSAYLDLTKLELERHTDVTLNLKDPSYPTQSLGSLFMTVTLVSKEIDLKGTNMHLNRSWQASCKAHKRDQLWRGVVGITLVKGQDLKPMDPNGLSDPYVKFKLGCQKYKSKTVLKTLNPEWREHFDFLRADEKEDILEITVWDKDSRKKDDFIGRCQINLSGLSQEHTHKLELNLSEGKGHLVLLLTLTALPPVDIANTSVLKLEEEEQLKAIRRKYSLSRTFMNLRDIGFVSLKIIRAEGLMVADVTGSSDPFCVIELNNDRLQTHTIHRSLNPIWNKVFTFNVKDIHSILELTVYDEDRDRTADFLGKVAIPLLSIQNGEERAYVLKNKNLTGPTKGVIYLEMEVIFNVIKACIRTITPKEEKYIEEEQRISKELLQKHYYRVKRCILVMINTGRFLNSCFEWESPQRSLTAFLIFLILVWNFELYMIPLILLLLMAYNYILLATGKDNRRISMQELEENLMEYEEDDDVKVDKETERKGLLDKLYAIQDICVNVQNGLDEAASIYERVKNTFNWTVPFLSWLAIFVLTVGTLILCFIPLRFVILVWGIHKFTKKLRNPYLIDNNELLDFLSRVHSDVQVVQYQELQEDSSQNSSYNLISKKKNNAT